ncbi:MAG: hypothetical protein K6F53_06255 [Lachnospiraceae bacterium]|nr:hypothetical protein [Lachnospiraceae bacterium]
MKNRKKQVFAWIAIIALLLLYLSVLVLALTGHGFDSNLFGFCILGTIFIPIFLWVVLWIAGKIGERKEDR